MIQDDSERSDWPASAKSLTVNRPDGPSTRSFQAALRPV
jgi:hypothetical protein